MHLFLYRELLSMVLWPELDHVSYFGRPLAYRSRDELISCILGEIRYGSVQKQPVDGTHPPGVRRAWNPNAGVPFYSEQTQSPGHLWLTKINSSTHRLGSHYVAYPSPPRYGHILHCQDRKKTAKYPYLCRPEPQMDCVTRRSDQKTFTPVKGPRLLLKYIL